MIGAASSAVACAIASIPRAMPLTMTARCATAPHQDADASAPYVDVAASQNATLGLVRSDMSPRRRARGGSGFLELRREFRLAADQRAGAIAASCARTRATVVQTRS